jgi:hypothetical protein
VNGVHAHVTWPQCVGRARSTGQRCQARAVLGTRCWNHCGATINAGWGVPKPTWSLHLVTSGVFLVPSRMGRGRTPKEQKRFDQRWPKRVRWWAAVQLIVRGRIAHALIFRRNGQQLLEAAGECGVRVTFESQGRLASRVRFDMSSTAQVMPWSANRHHQHRSRKGDT